MSREKPFTAIYWHSCVEEIRSLSSSQENKVREKNLRTVKGLMGHLRKTALPPIEVP